MCLSKGKRVESKTPVSSIGYCAQLLVRKNWVTGLYFGESIPLDIGKKVECDGHGFHGYVNKRSAIETARVYSSSTTVVVLKCKFNHLIERGVCGTYSNDEKVFRAKYRTILEPLCVYKDFKKEPLEERLSERVLSDMKKKKKN